MSQGLSRPTPLLVPLPPILLNRHLWPRMAIPRRAHSLVRCREFLLCCFCSYWHFSSGSGAPGGAVWPSRFDTRTRTTEGSATRVPLALARYNAPGGFALTLAHTRAYQMLVKDENTRAHLLHNVPIQDVDLGDGNNHAERLSGRDEAATMATIGSGRSSHQLPSRQPSERGLLPDCEGDRAGSLEELNARRMQITAEIARLDTEIARLQVESSRSAPPTYITNEGQIGTVSVPARETPADVKQASFKFKLRAWLYRT
jgi:hypothetical protein